MDINNNIALVTGAASGLGAATAKALATSGAKVICMDLNSDAVQGITKEVAGYGVTADVSNTDSVAKAMAEAKEMVGVARVCVNCAGIAPAGRIVGRKGPLPLEDFAKVININLIGTFNVMRLFAAELMQLDALAELAGNDGDVAERGVIINTASVAAFEGQIGQAAYSASKGGVAAMTLPAAREFAKFGIRVNTIAPGLFATPMMLGMPQDVQDSLAATIPFPNRFGKPEEYASMVAHIIENQMINGAVMRLDGALRMAAK